MQFSYLVTFESADPSAHIGVEDLQRVAEVVTRTPQLRRARLYTPESAKDFYTDDGPSPPFAMQLDFDTLTALESAIAVDGHLQAVAQLSLPNLRGCTVTQQVMSRRPFPVEDSIGRSPVGSAPCSFLVHYPGHAADFDAWLNYYLGHHPQIMRFFPGIREIEIFTRVDWVDAMPWKKVHYIQRNKLVFDSAQAITEAMNSPVRHQMRADFEKFPRFHGGNVHFPMATHTYTLS
nr:EthD family reductase [uncultured Cupriavidus sp.]